MRSALGDRLFYLDEQGIKDDVLGPAAGWLQTSETRKRESGGAIEGKAKFGLKVLQMFGVGVDVEGTGKMDTRRSTEQGHERLRSSLVTQAIETLGSVDEIRLEESLPTALVSLRSGLKTFFFGSLAMDFQTGLVQSWAPDDPLQWQLNFGQRAIEINFNLPRQIPDMDDLEHPPITMLMSQSKLTDRFSRTGHLAQFVRGYQCREVPITILGSLRQTPAYYQLKLAMRQGTEMEPCREHCYAFFGRPAPRRLVVPYGRSSNR